MRPTESTEPVVDLARRLDSANGAFHEGPPADVQPDRQRAQARTGRTTLHLKLHRSDAALALQVARSPGRRRRLAASGALLLPPCPPELTAFRRHYIAAIVEQLDPAR
jgi:hypothetical protein